MSELSDSGRAPRVAVVPDGSFLVIWGTAAEQEDRVVCRAFNVAGVALGSTFRVGLISPIPMNQPAGLQASETWLLFQVVRFVSR